MSERWVDVSHEALIRGWPRLRRWIEEDRAGLRVHRRLTEAALEWDKTGRDNGSLYRGTRLAQAIEWRQGKEASLNDLERAFLDAGLALERQEIESSERVRRRVIGGLSVALAIFAVLAGLALLQWRQSNRRGQIALARQLAAQADLLRVQPEMLSRRLWLAAEAMQRLYAVGSHSLEVDVTLRREIALSPRHIARFPVEVKGSVDDMQLSPDGRSVIGGNYLDGVASIWEIATGKELVRIETSVRDVTVTRLGQKPVRLQIEGTNGSSEIKGLSTDGKALVTVNGDGTIDVVQVWETVNGRELLRLRLPGINHYALSQDGRYLAASTSTYDNATSNWSEAITRVWNVKAGKEIPGSASGDVLDFSQGATFVATSSGLWEVAGGLKERLAWTTRADALAISPENELVAVYGGGNEGVELWSIAAGQSIKKLEVNGDPLALAPGGTLAIFAGDEETQVYSAAGRFRAGPRAGHAVFTPSGQELIATPSVDGKAVDVWELRPEGGAVIAVDHGGTIVAVGLTSQGRLTTIAQNGEKLISRTWDVNTGQEKPELAVALDGKGAAFAPDGLSFAVMSENGLELRRVGEPQPVAKLAYANPHAVAWSPDGRYLAAATEREARVWDLSSHRSMGQIALPGKLKDLALAGGGEALAAVVGSGKQTRVGEVHTAKLWNVSSGEELKSFEPDEGQSLRTDTHCALNARYLVTRDLKVREMKSGAMFSKPVLDQDAAYCVLSTDERYLATSSGDGIVRVWDLKSAKEAFRITTQEDPSALVPYSPLTFDQESRYLATIQGSTVRVWSLRQDDLIAEACRRLPRNLSEQEWREYVGDDAYHKTCPKLP
jgi:WD40 repeat protein